MPEEKDTCYNCVHHQLCKFEPSWIHMPTGSEEQSIRWFKEGPILVASICQFYKRRQDK